MTTSGDPRTGGTVPSEAPSTDLPLVAFALGDRPDALLASSTFTFDFFQIRAMDSVLVTRPVRLRHGRKRGVFELPFAGVVAISFVGGAITGARVCPHSGSLTADEAHAVAADVVPRLVGAGYRAAVGLGKGVDALPALLAAERERKVDMTLLVGKWSCGDDAVLVEVERSFAASEKNPEPRHAVRLRIENATLHRRAAAAITGAGHNVVWKRKAAPAS